MASVTAGRMAKECGKGTSDRFCAGDPFSWLFGRTAVERSWNNKSRVLSQISQRYEEEGKKNKRKELSVLLTYEGKDWQDSANINLRKSPHSSSRWSG